MTKLPRDISGDQLGTALKVLDYRMTRQTGSHMRLTTLLEGEHHITIPRHNALRIGTLNAILLDVCSHFRMTREQLLQRIF